MSLEHTTSEGTAHDNATTKARSRRPPSPKAPVVRRSFSEGGSLGDGGRTHEEDPLIVVASRENAAADDESAKRVVEKRNGLRPDLRRERCVQRPQCVVRPHEGMS